MLAESVRFGGKATSHLEMPCQETLTDVCYIPPCVSVSLASLQVATLHGAHTSEIVCPSRKQPTMTTMP